MNADRINEHYYGDILHPTTQRCRQRIHWICKQIEGQRILDVGCSQGIVCLLLGREGFDCTGVDIEEDAIGRARSDLEKEEEHVRKRVKFQLADAKSLPFEDGSFDSVLLCEILEHLTHPQRVLKEVHRVLKNNGKVVVTVPYGLLAHHDHKQTFYPLSLLETIQPFFRTILVDSLHSKQLVYCGTKDDAYDLERAPKESLLLEYRKWERGLEERCASTELSLAETSERLGEQVKLLKEQLEQSGEASKALQEDISNKVKSIQDLETSLEQARATAVELRELATKTQAESAAEASKANQLEEALEAKEVQLRALESDVVQARASIAAFQQATSEAEAESTAQAGRIKELQEAIAAKDGKIQELEGQLEQGRASIAALGQTTARAEAESAGQAARIKELHETVAARESQVRNLEEAIEEARAAAADLRGAAARADAEASSQAGKLKELQGIAVTRANQIQELQAGFEQARASAAEFRQQIAQMEATAMAHAAKVRGLEEIVTTKESRIRELESRAKQEHDLGVGLREKMAQGDATQARLRTEAASANTALASMEPRIKALEAENAQLRQQLSTKEAGLQQRLAQVEALHAARLRERERQQDELAGKREVEWKRKLANQRVRDTARLALPADARVLVISKGDDDLLHLDGRFGQHFPQTTGGVYAGHHPADAGEAIRQLETLKSRAAEFLLIPAASFWWLDFYKDFRRHLETQYRLLVYNEDCVIFALTAPAANNGRLGLSFDRTPSAETKTCPPPSTNGGTSAPEPIIAPRAVVAPLPAPEAANRNITPSVEVAAAKAPSASPSTEAPAPPSKSVPGPGPDRINMGVSAVVPGDSAPGAASGRLKVACIFDEFTAACFRPECSVVTFRPDNWKSILDANPVDLLFIESAWQGNGGSWQYKIASYHRPMGEELTDLVSYCKSRNIPTVFWNKEDPPHFNRFIHRAPLFDFVFTSDADMIPKYREAVKHNRVTALPFAAQPRIHNPILEAERQHNVCFAGAYYATDHDERRGDMEHILRPALAFGLHIYDRQHGVAGTNAKAYQFPEIYQSAIRGRLEYEEMIKAYKWYRVFLNVNSVKRSPTMFSRRVFELLASGTPVVSSYSKGILELLGKDIVHLAESEQETLAHLERLLHDERYWAEVSLRGLREVCLKHTYAHRLAEICRNVGLPVGAPRLPAIGAVAKIQSDDDIRRLTAALAGQTYRRFNLTLASGKAVTSRRLEVLRASLPGVEIRVLPRSTDLWNYLAQGSKEDLVWLVNLSDYYGDNFLQDVAIATSYTDAEIIGKATSYAFGSSASTAKLNNPGSEFKFVLTASPGSLVARAGKVRAEQWKALAANRAIDFPNLRLLSIDRFNYVQHGASIERMQRKGASKTLAPALV